jgi:preprotein translocase subunit SecD
MRQITLRWSSLGMLVVLALYFLYPTYFYYFQASDDLREDHHAFCQALPAAFPCVKLNLGLDLQGGVHLVMGVGTQKAISHYLDRLAEGLRQELPEAMQENLHLRRGQDDVLLASWEPKTEQSQVDTGLESLAQAAKKNGVLRVIDKSARSITWALHPTERERVVEMSVEQSIKTIRNRADKLGVTEPTIMRRGEQQILIQLPGIKDPDHALRLIGKTAQLEFHFVSEEGSAKLASIPKKSLPPGVRKLSHMGQLEARHVYFELPIALADKIREQFQPFLPENTVLAFGPALHDGGGEKPNTWRTYVLEERAEMTGDSLIQAQVAQEQEGGQDYYVMMRFDTQGAKQFEKLTGQHVGQAMAIVLDGKVTSAPVINERIAGGSARITLGRSGDPQSRFQEAKDLVLILKAGALPAPVEVQEKRQVGKTLGQDTVRQGALAMGLGTFLVLAFMAWYYRWSGMIANVALVLNVLFMLAILALLEATLTLPGMAGIVLTVGMAVDANVLIFERIREELRLGKGVHTAIELGYAKAMGTIVDSNVTTMIAGLVLMQYGSGAIQGFAITLMVGLLCSMYTAIVVTRLIFDTAFQRKMHKRQLVALSI